MTFYYSNPFEDLLAEKNPNDQVLTTARVLIIGSGYGGAVAAYRLARVCAGAAKRTHGVLVLERGREYALGEFPMTLDELPGSVRAVRAGRAKFDSGEDSLFDFRVGDGVDVLVGSGLGGTSLINANVALRPTNESLQRTCWPEKIRAEAGVAGSPLSRAYDEVERWLTDTGQGETGRLSSLTKFKAFSKYSAALRFDVNPAPLAVTLGKPGTSKVNAAGVRQKVCTHCGNCVTGCNIGAKNTLAMNFIPAARREGARFFTGAHALRVNANPRAGRPRWRVQVQASTRETRVRFDDTYYIEADIVILAAGALGSTEILKRSERDIPLSLSLGYRFSTNGDGIALSFGEDKLVHGLGRRNQADPDVLCGPTITAVADGVTKSGDRFTLEDGAIPAGLIEILGEVITTSAQAGRLGGERLPGWFGNKNGGVRPDVLSVHREALERSQLFLIMADDGARGQLRFDADASDADADEVRIVPVWPPASGTDGPSPVLSHIEDVLAKHDRKKGMNQGQYVHNPLWQLIPPSAGGAMSGRFPGGRLLSVHPLGGCPMADSGRFGVVNDAGQAFVGTGDKTHEGLYVLDGAIVTGALGVNPFLTIAALAWRACDTLIGQLELTSGASASHETVLQPPSVPLARPTALVSRIVFSEQLVGRLETPNVEIQRALSNFAQRHSKTIAIDKWLEYDAIVIRLETKPFALSDLETSSGAIPATLELHVNPVSGAIAERAHTYGVPPEHLSPETLIALGTGTISFMTPQYPTGWWDGLCRTVEAFLAYFSRRESPWSLFRSQFVKTTDGPKQSWWSVACSMVNVAAMHGTYRDFHYTLRFGTSPTTPIMLVTGTKRLAWRRDNPRLWASLLQLCADLSLSNCDRQGRVKFKVDMNHLVGDGLIRVARGDSVPLGVHNCIAFAMRVARGIMQTSFWEFGAPAYPAKPLVRHPQLPERLKCGAALEAYPFTAPEFLPSNVLTKFKSVVEARHDLATLDLMLHCYRATEARRSEPVLLIHGLAQGSLIYAHLEHPMSMAEYFVQNGYDVWLLDYRLSNLFDSRQIPYDNWSIDEIGAFDVPRAVNKILAQYGHGVRVHVFAHCVGAIATTMAILNGDLTKNQLASVALNAIHPWTAASPANRVRAKLGVFAREWLSDQFFDPIVPTRDEVDATQSLTDRLAFSLARLGETKGAFDRTDDDRHTQGPGRGMSNAICDRMTFLYGRMWNHENVRHLHDYWKDLVGRAPGTVQRHLYYLLIHGRVASHEGINDYLIEKHLVNWHGIRTLFMHGEDSQVFNPQSATNSAVRLRRVLRYLRKSYNKEHPHSPLRLTPVRLKRITGYGHMDPILASSAARESFSYLHEFFRGGFDRGITSGQLKLDRVRAKDDPHQYAKQELIAGPVLRAARVVGENLLLVRLWGEVPSDNTSPVEDLEITEPTPLRAIPVAVQGVGEQYIWKDVIFQLSNFKTIKARAKKGGSGTTMFSLGLSLGQDSRTAAVEVSSSSSIKGATHIEVLDDRSSTWVRRLQERPGDCHFLVGSCRYPGTPFDRHCADQAFEGMLTFLDSKADIDLLFLIGDQIYADATAGLLDPSVWRDRYVDRYRAAFHSPAVKSVLAAIPCHFAVDDHEFADNFAGAASVAPGLELQNLKEGGISREQFEFARDTAQAYMDSGRSATPFGHVPAPNAPTDPAPPHTPARFWYALDDEAEISCPAFILDTRAERERAQGTTPAQLMHRDQMAAFLEWLASKRRDPRPKFLFLGSPIIPLTRDFDEPSLWMRQDGPTGYRAELSEIVTHVVKLGIERVVFVGGDPHLSCTATMSLKVDGGQAIDALHVVSSGLYAPLPFANLSPDDVYWNRPSTIKLTGCQIDYIAELLIPRPTEPQLPVPPHFIRVSAKPTDDSRWMINVEAYGRCGTILANKSFGI